MWSFIPGVVAHEQFEFHPTEATPGSEEKIQVLEERYRRGLPLHHADDANTLVPIPASPEREYTVGDYASSLRDLSKAIESDRYR